MSEGQKRIAALVLLTRFQPKGEIYAVLRVQGRYNLRERRPTHNPGSLMLTCVGEAAKDEDMRGCLVRHLSNQLGLTFAQKVFGGYAPGKVWLMPAYKTEKITVEIFAVEVQPDDICDLVRLTVNTGGLDYVTESQAREIIPLHGFNPRGVCFEDGMRIMPSEYRDDLLKVFELIKT